MNRGFPQLGFPRLRGAVKWLMIVNIAVFILDSILISRAPEFERSVIQALGLTPSLAFLHGWLWQLFTYQFLHGDTYHIFFNMIALYMFGSSMESYWGSRRFYGVYTLCVLGGGLAYTAASLAHAFLLNPAIPLIGASGGVMGAVVAFGTVYANAEVYLFPFPITIKAKYIAILFMGMAVLGAIRYENPGSAIAHLGGGLTAFLYVRFVPRLGMKYVFSESYFGLLNRWHTWQRKRAARKFEVYMRQHDKEGSVDDETKFRGPKDKSNGEGKGGWVN